MDLHNLTIDDGAHRAFPRVGNVHGILFSFNDYTIDRHKTPFRFFATLRMTIDRDSSLRSE
jgi:hypothetical protein